MFYDSCHSGAVRARATGEPQRVRIIVQCEQMAQDAQIKRAEGFLVLGLGA